MGSAAKGVSGVSFAPLAPELSGRTACCEWA